MHLFSSVCIVWVAVSFFLKIAFSVRHYFPLLSVWLEIMSDGKSFLHLDMQSTEKRSGKSNDRIVLTEKKMDFLLRTSTVQRQTFPTPSPSAQYTILCDSGSNNKLTILGALSILQAIKQKNRPLYVIGWLLFSYGLRISEVLSIRGTHFRNGYKIFIPGKKRSGIRYINYEAIKDELFFFIKNEGEIFTGYSRFYVYRELKKLGLVISVKGNYKKSVTHAGRHLNAQELVNSGDQVASVQTFFSHKSINSTKKYTDDKTKKNHN